MRCAYRSRFAPAWRANGKTGKIGKMGEFPVLRFIHLSGGGRTVFHCTSYMFVAFCFLFDLWLAIIWWAYLNCLFGGHFEHLLLPSFPLVEVRLLPVPPGGEVFVVYLRFYAYLYGIYICFIVHIVCLPLDAWWGNRLYLDPIFFHRYLRPV